MLLRFFSLLFSDSMGVLLFYCCFAGVAVAVGVGGVVAAAAVGRGDSFWLRRVIPIDS